MGANKPFQPRRVALRIAIVYIVLGGLWILLSDKGMAFLTDDPDTLTILGIVKGWAYVLFTGLLLYRLIFSQLRKQKEYQEMEAQAHSREMKARLNTLESQINPHFLYNILTVIGSVGEQAGVDKVAELCEKVGSMFRYTLQHPDKEVTVRDEIMFAQLYLELMKVRYEDHLQYQVEIDEAALSYKVPRLIFQPHIENCFHHAFQTCNPPWEIHVSIKQTPDHIWLFEVKDSGSGFDPKIIAKLQLPSDPYINMGGDNASKNEELSGNFGGVGLFNTLMRMKLIYDRRAFYEITPNHPNGSIVRIGVMNS